MAKKIRTVWTTSEWSSVAKAWRAAGHPDDLDKCKNIIGALRNAQQAAALPPERQRLFNSGGIAKHQLKPLLFALAQLSAEERKQQQQALVPEQQQETSPHHEIDHLVSAPMTLEVVVREFARRMARIMIEAFTDEIQDQLPSLSAATPVKKRLPRMLIVGPKSEQGQMLQKRVAGVLDVRIVSGKDRDTGRLRSGCAWADYVILWVNWTDHSDRQLVLSSVDKSRFQQFEGKLEALATFLEEVAIKVSA
jgi:hypothetical protein